VTDFSWRPFLQTWGEELIEAGASPDLPADALESGWLGFAGATEEQLALLETRLGVALPPSYRGFLEVSNGWRHTGTSIERIWSTEEVDWFRVRNQGWIDAYVSPFADVASSGPALTDDEYLVYGEAQDPVRFRTEYLASALEISEPGDSAVYLLNPETTTHDGEWEAWLFANWLPGAQRHRSFAELMLAEHASFRELD
jgi:hypothetical protein